jgi:hypothetical protein
MTINKLSGHPGEEGHVAPVRRSLGRRALVAAASVLVVTAAAAGADSQVASAASSNFHASVAADGSVLAGNRVVSVSHLSTGRFEVTFDANVSACAYIATTANAASQAVQSYTAGGHLGPNGVYVEVKNQGGGLHDGPFNLYVSCSGTGTFRAVVGYAGQLVRSTTNTVLTNVGPGQYRVRFRSSVAGCAYLATVGDPGNALVFNPSGVYTARGPDSRTVLVETKNPGGGLQAGVPFHLAVVCPTAANTASAVIGTDGIVARASKLTSSLRVGTGSYQLVAGRSLVGCSTVGTRGSVDAAVPFSPATVETTAGLSPNSVGIQVRQLLFFGGGLLDEATHVASIC